MQENEVLKEVIKELEWKERIVVMMFKKIFINVYKKGVKEGFNWNNVH